MTAVLCCSLSSRAPLLAAWLDCTAGDSTTGSLLESPASTATLRGGVSLPFLQSVRHCVACCMRLRALPRCPSSLLECACLVLPHCCARCQLVVCASSARPAIGFVVSACRGPPSTRACCELQCDARLLLRFPSFEPIFLARSPFLPCAQTRILQARAGRETTRRREATHTTVRRWRGAGYRTEVLCRWWRGTRASAVIPGSST